MKKILDNNWFMIRYILKYCPSQVLFSLASSCLVSISGIVGVFFTKYVIESMIERKDLILVMKYALFLFIFNIFSSFINSWINQYIFPKNTQILAKNMQNEIFSKSLDLDYENYESTEFYNEFTQALQQSDSRALAILETFNSLLGSILGIFAFGIIVTIFDPILLLIVVINVLITTIYSSLNSKLQYQMYQNRILPSRNLGYSARVFYQIDYAKELRIFGKLSQVLKNIYHYNINKIIELIQKYSIKFLKRNISQSILFNISNLINTLYLAIQVIGNSITISEYFALITSVSQLTNQINQFIQVFPKFYENSLYVESFKKFMSLKSKIHSGNIIIEKNNCSKVELINVNFKYPSSDKILFKDLNLIVKSGEKVAIVGENGSGKSTIMKLLVRLYDPLSGMIRIDDKNLELFDIESYREQIGVIFQDFHIFALSIAENILMRPVDTAEDILLVENALRRVGLYEKILKTEHGIYTKITREFEDGIYMSGGELQKLAIARLYIKSNNLILLDEPSSSLDPISEKEFFEMVFDFFKEKTMIVVTHRLYNIKQFEKILYLENGKITETGTHDELMKINGSYAKLYKAQNLD